MTHIWKMLIHVQATGGDVAVVVVVVLAGESNHKRNTNEWTDNSSTVNAALSDNAYVNRL